MKVTPSNQTLILANERLPIASHSGSVAPALQRVTLIAAHPDSTLVYLQADYGAAGDADPIAALPSLNPAPLLPRAAGAVSLAMDDDDMAAARLPGAMSTSSGRGINLYARTQRLTGEAPRSRYIDVLA